MNVTVENLGPCKKLVRFEIEAEKIDQEFEATTKEVLRHASLPGFRPGKAPRDMVIKKFEKEIHDQVKQKLIGDAYKQAVKDNNLHVIGYPDLDEVEKTDVVRGQPFNFVANIETAPEFELPPYRGIVAKRQSSTVTEDDINRAIEVLRNQQAAFNTVPRPLQDGDIAVVNYTGTCEGKPITETAPTAKGLTEQKGFWVDVKKDSFIPGFTDQLLGAKAGDKRTVNVDFPADFVTPQLAGKKGVYEVELVEVKERVLPEINDAFAKTLEAENIQRLREGIRADLQNELNSKQKKSTRAQVVQSLFERVNCDLPESLVQHETRSSVYDIVSNIQKQGATKEVIDQQKEEIYAAASRTAKDRVKINFILQRIAEKEGMRVGQEELNARIILLAGQYKMAPDKFAKELEKRGAVEEVYLQLLNEKVVDFLVENAKFEDAPAEPAQPAQPAS